MQMAILALALLSLGLSAVAITRQQPLSWRFAVPEIVVTDAAPRFETIFDYTAPTGQAHSPGIVVQGGQFSIVWFEGSEEAQADVDIHAAHFARSAFLHVTHRGSFATPIWFTPLILQSAQRLHKL